MHHSIRSARPAAALALAVAATLLTPGLASATTTTPTGSATSTTAPTGSASTTTGTTTSTTADSTTSTASPSGTAKAKAVPFDGTAPKIPARIAGGAATQAAGFIVRTLNERDDHYNYPASDYFDGGNTIDAILGLSGAGVGLTQGDATTDYLADHVDDYVGYPAEGDPSTAETYAGPLGKLIIGVVAQGGDPTAFGGQDLIERLDGLLTEEGRFSDKSAYGDESNPTGDYSNTIGQVLDVIALGRATGDVPQSASDYLRDQQCSDGGFRGNLDVASAACTSDIDATAFAAQALVGLLGPEDPATVDALNFLAGHQAANGGFLNQDGQYNANTAGVAAQAFAVGGLTTQLAKAQSFLAGLQMDCSFAPELRGGIAFTAADRAILAKTSTDTNAMDRALRATPQATLGLAGGSLLTVSADGATGDVPTLSCPAPSPTTPTTTTTATATTTSPASTTTTTTSSAATTSSSSDPGVGGAGTADDDAGNDPASAAPASLAYTGADIGVFGVAGLLLLLLGAGALVLARRKGVHA